MPVNDVINKQDTTLRRRIQFAGWLNMIFSLIYAFVGVLLIQMMNQLPPLPDMDSADMQFLILYTSFIKYSGVILISYCFSLFIASIGLLKGYGWAKIIIIIHSVINLIFIPLGTIIGAYSLCVLLIDWFKQSKQPNLFEE